MERGKPTQQNLDQEGGRTVVEKQRSEKTGEPKQHRGGGTDREGEMGEGEAEQGVSQTEHTKTWQNKSAVQRQADILH